jgi:hypothetical protein
MLVIKAAAESLQSLASQDEDESHMNPTDLTRVSAAEVAENTGVLAWMGDV